MSVKSNGMGLLPDTENCGLRMRRECWERFPCHWLQRKPLLSYPGMHHNTCVSHVPWCMSGSLTSGGGENVPGACATCNFPYLARGPLICSLCYWFVLWEYLDYIWCIPYIPCYGISSMWLWLRILTQISTTFVKIMMYVLSCVSGIQKESQGCEWWQGLWPGHVERDVWSHQVSLVQK